jgi:Verrucomicrobium spinosum paralogous family TIGR02597
MFSKSHLLVVAVACIGGPSLSAQTTVTTDPVGLTTTSCLGNSDTYLGIPFTRPPEFTGTVQSANANTLTVNGAPGWANNQFVYAAGRQSKHYYVLIGNGGATNPKEGHTFTVTSNGSSTLTVDTSLDNLTGVTANTKVMLIPYWTPATIFPGSDAGISFTATDSPPAYKTQLLVPNTSATGINLPPAATYFFINNGSNVGWRFVGDNTTDHNDDPLLPDSYLIVRNANGAPTLPLTATGSVLMSKLAVPIIASGSQQQDNPVAMLRPVDVTLDANGLTPIDNSFVQGDQLLLFDNLRQQIGKQPSKTYTFNDGWRLSSDNLDHSKDIIPAGSAMLVRRAAKSDGGIVYWVNAPTYVAAMFLSPLAASSRKVHGSAGTFDVNLAASNSLGVECRAPGLGNSHQIVFTFAHPVTVADAAVTVGPNVTGSVVGSPMVNGNHVTVNLSNVSNQQRLTIKLLGVSDGTITNDFSVPLGILLGDVNGNGAVESSDVSAVQGHTRQKVSNSTFMYDVNANGAIESSDVSTTQAQTRTSIPPSS